MYSVFTVEQLKNPSINLVEGMRMLQAAKLRCKHKQDKTWLICYNQGVSSGSRIKNPKSQSYYKQVMSEYSRRNNYVRRR